MKIADAETIVVGTPPPHFGGRYFVFVKLTSADGIVGWGEVYAATFAPSVVERMVADVAGRHFIGADPRDIEAIWRKVYGRGYTLRPDASLVGVLSGLEIACWDLVGKALDTPVHRLLGGRVRERLRTYTYLLPEPGDDRDVYTDPDMAAERAAQNVERGFTAVKFDPAGPYTVFDGHQPSLDDLDRSETFCSAVRDAVGNAADILFGTHGQFTPAGALRLAGRIEEYDPLWFEEPTPPENPEAMAEVAAGTSIPISTGERLVTKYEFHQVLAAGAAHILQPALGRVGGILEAKKVAAIAEPYYAQIAPHLYAGPIEAAANVQLCATLPNFLIVEGIADWGGFHAELMSTPNRWERGFVEVPDAPGLGVELNEDVARAHPYDDTPLHLEMREEPLP
jgi:L-alanine-DL-glutamate epimerase-like enolase superfamily enzyme